VVTRSGDIDTSWQGSVLLRDIASVKRLREEDGPDLVTQGSTEPGEAPPERDMNVLHEVTPLVGIRLVHARQPLDGAPVRSNGLLVEPVLLQGGIRHPIR
jgi:hypothetical protein